MEFVLQFGSWIIFAVIKSKGKSTLPEVIILDGIESDSGDIVAFGNCTTIIDDDTKFVSSTDTESNDDDSSKVVFMSEYDDDDTNTDSDSDNDS